MATVDQIRALVGDTGVVPLLDDTSYEVFISLDPDINKEAAMACRAIAAQFAQESDLQAGPVKLSLSQSFDHYMAMASKFDAEANSSSVVGIELSGVSLPDIQAALEDSDTPAPLFTITDKE